MVVSCYLSRTTTLKAQSQAPSLVLSLDCIDHVDFESIYKCEVCIKCLVRVCF
jgi:hypothetical protein